MTNSNARESMFKLLDGIACLLTKRTLPKSEFATILSNEKNPPKENEQSENSHC